MMQTNKKNKFIFCLCQKIQEMSVAQERWDEEMMGDYVWTWFVLTFSVLKDKTDQMYTFFFFFLFCH